MTYLTRDQILKAADFKYAEIACPEWGGTVLIRSLTGTERDQFEADTLTQRGKIQILNLRNVRARLVSLCIISDRVENGGKRVFSDSDVLALGDKSAAALDRVFTEAMKLSGLTETDVKELAGNFDEGQSDTSGSA